MIDNSTEAWLSARNLSWQYVQSMALTQIHVSHDAREQIRLSKALDEDYVAPYTQRYLDGTPMPAIVVCEIDSRIEVLDGLHRLAAAERASKPSLDVYRVKVDSLDMVERIRRTINSRNGKSLPLEERKQHALRLVAMGTSPKDAAREYGLTESTVTARIRADRQLERLVNIADGRLTASNIESSIAGTALAKLQGVKRDDLAAEIARLAIRTRPRLTAKAIEDMIRDAANVVNDADAKTLISNWAKTYPEPTKTKQTAGHLQTERAVVYQVRMVLQRALTSVKKTVHEPKLTKDERNQIGKILGASIKELAGFRDANAAKANQQPVSASRSFRATKLRKRGAGRNSSHSRHGAYQA